MAEGRQLAIARRRKIAGVMGSGSKPHARLSRPVGRLLAARGCHLLTGGGSGVMAAVSRAFYEMPDREGLCLGVVRSQDTPRLDEATGRRSYRPARFNPWVEIPIYTHLPLSSESLESRNHINVLTADVLIALPGGSGTLSEVRLRLQYGRPVIVFLGDPVAGRTIGGLGAGALRDEAREPELLFPARNLDELERQLDLEPA